MTIQQRNFMKSANSGPPNRRWRFIPALAVGATLLVGGVVPASGFAATIQGTVFTDSNNNGDWDSGEALRANETIFIRDNTHGGFFMETTGDSGANNGKYLFTTPNAGSFTMWTAIPPGWTQTAPKRGVGIVFYNVQLDNAQSSEIVNFGFVDPTTLANNPPKALLGKTTMTVNVGNAVNFTGSFNDPDANDTHIFNWDFDDGRKASGTLNPNHTYASPGTYEVVLTVTDNRGDSGTAKITVTVNNVPPTVNIEVSPTIVKTQDLVTFTTKVNDTSGDTHTYLWDFGNTKTSTLPNPTHTYTGGGTYPVKLKVTDNHSGIGTATTTIVIDNATPIVEAGQDVTITAGETANFKGKVTDADANDTHTFKWDFGDSKTATTQDAAHTYKTAGTYTATLTVTDSQGGVGTDTLKVTVNGALPIVEVGEDITVNVGQSVTFRGSFTDADDNGDTSFTFWKFGDGNTKIGEANSPGAVDVPHTFNEPGAFTATLKVVDSDGNQGTGELAVQVRSIDDEPCAPNIPTIETNGGFWGPGILWNTLDGTPPRVPNESDWVRINTDSHVTLLYGYEVNVKGLCIEENAVLQGITNSKVSIREASIHNKGTIQSANGTTSFGSKSTTSGSNIEIFAYKVLNDDNGIIGPINPEKEASDMGDGRGGDHLPFQLLPNKTHKNALGAAGGQVEVHAAIITNRGRIEGSKGGNAYGNEYSFAYGKNGYFTEGHYTKRVIGGATGGKGGSVVVSATNIDASTSTGILKGGCGGSAFGKRKSNYPKVSLRSIAGKGGDVTANMKTVSKLTGCSGGSAHWDPIMLKATSATRFEGFDEVTIFGGDDATLDLSELSEGAISAEKITIAAGKGGVVNLPKVSGKVFKSTVKMEIFADEIRLDGVTLTTEEAKEALKSLVDAPPDAIVIAPSKTIFHLEISSENNIVEEPSTTVPLHITLNNSGPTEDTYTVSVTDSAGWNMGTLPETVTVNSMRRSDLALNVTLPATRGEEDIITITATSQGDPDVQAVAEIRVTVKEEEVITPRGDEKAEITIVIDSTMIGGELIVVSNALETLLHPSKEDLPPEENALTGEQLDNMTDEELETFLANIEVEEVDSPTIELITFEDDVVSRVVTQNLAEVITRIRNIQPSGGDDCPNASVAAIEKALENINPDGKIILTTASAPHKDAAAAIAKAQEQGVNISVLLAGSCGDVEADKALYKHIADETGGSFTWLPRGITAIQDVPLEKVISEVITKVVIPESNQQPTAALAITPESGKAPLTVALDGSSSTDTDGNITSHAWTASNGQTAEGQNAELTFNDAGKYTITLKVTDNDGATHSASSQQITVAKQGEYTAHGTLRDELGQPIVGAKVQIGDNTTTTDDAGNWAISGLQEGDDYTVKASKDGYTFAPENMALGNEVFKQNVTFKPVSALSVKVVAKPPVVKQDDNVTYTMTVINGGEETATNVALNSVLPAGTTLVSLEALDGGNCDTDTLSCTLSELATGGSARFKIVINNTQAKALVTQTTVTANEYPADVAKKWTRVIPYLSVSISDTPDPLEMAQADVDRMLHYTLAVELSENAPSAATGVELVATLPQGVELKSVNSDYGMCDLSESPKLTCSMTDLSVDSADDISKVTLDVDVVLKDAGILVLTHEAKVTANEYPAHTDRERTKVFIPESVQVDIAFVIDDTGSMQGEINGVKKALIAFIEEIDTSEAPLSVLLTFGDEVKYRAVTQDMTVLRDAIGKLKASGGGTCPEASYEAISFAIPHVKKGGTILFATDASPYEGSDVEEMIVRLRNKGIIFNAMIFGDCSDENSWNEQPE